MLLLLDTQDPTFVLSLTKKQKEKIRVPHGKPAKLLDTSNHRKYEAAPNDIVNDNGMCLGNQAFLDLNDKQNDEVICTLACRA